MTTFLISHNAGVEYPVGREERVSLQDIADLVKSTKADRKEDLPLITAGTFGPSRERRNANMERITAIMGDFDRGDMTPEEAARKLRDAKVIGLIYTSPRHEMDGKGSRWRVMCPLAEPVTLFEHAALAQRLNGIFGQDTLGTEGRSASRPYYIGSINGRPDCQTIIVEGDECRYLDHASDIPEIRFPRSEHDKVAFPPVAANAEAHEIAQALLDQARQYTGGHQGLWSACLQVAPFVRIGALDGEEVAAVLQEQLEVVSSRGSDVPSDEALRTLLGAVNSDICTEKTEAYEMALQLEEMTVTQAAQRLSLRYSDASHDFDSAEPLPPNGEEDRRYQKSKDRYTFLSYDDLCGQPEPEWLIESLIPTPSYGFISGQYATLKSFWVMDLMAHIALGKDYGGRRVKQGLCFYILGEGTHDARYRMEAAFAKHGERPNGLILTLPRAVTLTSESDVAGLIAAMRAAADKAGLPVAACFIDTLTRSLTGQNFNDMAVMTLAVNACDRIKEELHCVACPVAHAGKDAGKGAAGSFVIGADADFEFRSSRTKSATEDVLTVENIKQKYAAEAPPMYFDAVQTKVSGDKDTVTLHERVTPPGKQGDNEPKANPKHARLLERLVAMRDAIPNSPVDTDALITECQDDTELSNCSKRCDRRRKIADLIGKAIAARVIIRDGDNLLPGAGGDLIMPPVDDHDDDRS
jgi:hypothetical protein